MPGLLGRKLGLELSCNIIVAWLACNVHYSSVQLSVLCSTAGPGEGNTAITFRSQAIDTRAGHWHYSGHRMITHHTYKSQITCAEWLKPDKQLHCGSKSYVWTFQLWKNAKCLTALCVSSGSSDFEGIYIVDYLIMDWWEEDLLELEWYQQKVGAAFEQGCLQLSSHKQKISEQRLMA